MMKTDTILEFLGLKDVDESTVNLDDEVEKLLLAEIEEVLAEMAAEHADTEKYKKLVENFNTLTKSYNEFKRGQAETVKANADLERNRQDQVLKICDTGIKVLGIGLSAGLTWFYFCVEQGRPTPVRYINKCQDLLTRVR